MTPTKCHSCGESIPPTLPRYTDDLGRYVICPACSSSQDDDTPTTPEE
jgi:DNA-directed RNA polymerase subunit RPC12/RpoP